MSKRVWQVFVSGYTLVEAETAEAAERRAVATFEPGCESFPRFSYEATDDVTESPRFARNIEIGDVIR